jgi:sirohydrochlorin ferrochelatase
MALTGKNKKQAMETNLENAHTENGSPPLPADTAVILIDHGSRRQAANDMLEAMAEVYRSHCGGAMVEVAHMELAEPTLAQAVDKCVARGAREIVVALFFLSPGRHSQQDIPALVEQASARHPAVAIRMTAPLGVDPRLAEVIQERVAEVLKRPEQVELTHVAD